MLKISMEHIYLKILEGPEKILQIPFRSMYLGIFVAEMKFLWESILEINTIKIPENILFCIKTKNSCILWKYFTYETSTLIANPIYEIYLRIYFIIQ